MKRIGVIPFGGHAFFVGVVLLVGCGGSGGDTPTPDAAATDAWFAERAAEAGIDFVHVNGMTGAFYYAEVMPPGLALFDFDADGDLDLFAVQGHGLGEHADPPPGTLRAHLYRNDSDGGTLRFTDVTDASGIEARGYGMGAATGDFDNDGCVDLYVTNLGSNQLFRNNCDGTFADVTHASGTADPGWSVSAAFVDVDRDGWLDLFVGHYLNYRVENNVACRSLSGLPDYCPPHVYAAQPSRLFRNTGNGTFIDITTRAGLSQGFGPALGVATADFDGDGWIDIYVANDGFPNNLWINQRDGTFRDTARLAGAAVSPDGLAKASMGVDAADFDGDGDEDLFITELAGQGADLYVNDGSGVFVDASARAGLRLATLPTTGFGAAWLDADNDGLLDLAAVNGAVTHTAEALARGERFALAQPRQLFRNIGGGRFEDVSDRAGAAFQTAEVGRGAAFGDIDNDGDIDIAVANGNGPLRLFVNTVGSRNHWIGLRLVGSTALTTGGRARDMLGARVAIARADGTTLWRRARADGSYASANDPRVLAGLGTDPTPPRVRVQWPDGQVEEWTGVPVDRYSTLQQGSSAKAR